MNANNTKKFIKLVQENPELPVIPMVASDVVCDDWYRWWMGSFGHCEVTEYVWVEMYGQDRFVTRDDQDEIIEYFINEIVDDDETLSDEEVVAMATERVNTLDWIKAIVVWITV